MTALEVICMLRGVASVDAQEFVPAVRYRNKLWIDGCTKARNNLGQRILEIFIFPTPETILFHHHSTTEKIVAPKQGGDLHGFLSRKDATDNRVTLRVEIFRNLPPVGIDRS